MRSEALAALKGADKDCADNERADRRRRAHGKGPSSSSSRRLGGGDGEMHRGACASKHANNASKARF